MTLLELARAMYEKYQLSWMIDHGYTMDNLVRSLSEYMDDTEEPLLESYWMWEQESGFEGSIWECFAEFLTAEFRDADYIFKLANNDQYGLYAKAATKMIPEEVLCFMDGERYVLGVWSSDRIMSDLELYYFDRIKALEAIKLNDAVEFLTNREPDEILDSNNDQYWELAEEFLTNNHMDGFVFQVPYEVFAESLFKQIRDDQ